MVLDGAFLLFLGLFGVCHIAFWVGAHNVTQPHFLRMSINGKQSLWICLMTFYQLQFVLSWHRAD
jgi:hypothetical protein